MRLPNIDLGSKLTELGINPLIIGIGIVILVLILLAFLTWLISSIIDGIIRSGKARKEAKAQALATAASLAEMANIPAYAVPVPVAPGFAAYDATASSVPLTPDLPVPDAPADIQAVLAFEPQACPAIPAQTVAVIMAAVSAISGVPVSQFHFTAIRRLPTAANPWANSGTADIISGRQHYL